jgi:hypothetical protein
MCDLVNGAPIATLAERVFLQVNVLEVCFKDLMITLFGLYGSLVNINATAYGSPLPINDPTTLFTATASNSIMCLDVACAILNDPSGATAAQICAPVLANAPATTTTATSSASTATSKALPTNWPGASAFTGNGQCVACRLSQYIEDVQINAIGCGSPSDPNQNPYAGLNITNPPVTAYDLSLKLCDATFRPLGFQAMCDQLCPNECDKWKVDALIAGMGGGFVKGSLKNSTVMNECLV